VVERPASIVKELVENALDAEAKQIDVAIEAGGKRLVRVRDDGRGMDREDACLAIERHATSKLKSIEDLCAVTTHGFRGEALPSIASVAHLVLKTRAAEHAAGTEIEIEQGRIKHVRDVGHPRGTTIEVNDLFSAVPARRKFLRADATEASHVIEVVTQTAIAYPCVGFTLMSNGRSVLAVAPSGGLAARIFAIYGEALADDLLPLESGEGWARVTGFVSRPDRPRELRSNVRIFVNGRAVRDRAIAKAVTEGYRKASVAQPTPDAFIFLELPFDRVDVNVHPAKTEVRFADMRIVFSAVENAVRQALSAGARETLPRARTSPLSDLEQNASEPPLIERLDYAVAPYAARAVGTPAPSGTILRLREKEDDTLGEAALAYADVAAPIVLGQHRQTYIIATDGEELVLIDQHTAHERVRFEALMGGLTKRSIESQLYLTPQIVPIDPRLLPIVEARAEALHVLGFEVEIFGGSSISLRSVPAMLAGRDPGPTIEGILRDFLEREETEWAVKGDRERLAATVACHSAVRAGEALKTPSMQAIVKDLLTTEHPALCPHGRPTVIRIPKDDLSRWFGRKGWRRA
jgi:DNA mismatch repair protein MutL